MTEQTHFYKENFFVNAYLEKYKEISGKQMSQGIQEWTK